MVARLGGGGKMIQSTPNYITTYRALNRFGEWEDGTALHPDADYGEYLKSLGYKKIEILETHKK
jgi:hypothetical protein